MATWNPFTPGYFENPYLHLGNCRKNNPVQKGVHGEWIFFKHKHAKEILKSNLFNASDLSSYLASKENLILGDSACPFLAKGTRKWMMYLNGAEHAETAAIADALLRKMPFTELIELAITKALPQFQNTSSFDLADLAAQIPYFVSSKMLGYNEAANFERLCYFSHQLAVSQDMYLSKNDYRKVNAEFEWAFSEFGTMLSAKRTDGEATLIGLAKDLKANTGNQLSEEELYSLLCILFMASFETTKDTLGAILFELLKKRELLTYIISANQKEINVLTEELLRMAAPLQYTVRVCKEKTEIDGYSFPKGTKLYISLASANRDEDIFDNPDEVDINRADNPHLSFGGGTHSCLGARIARQEIRTWLKPLSHFLLNYRLDEKEKPQWQRTIFMRGLKHLKLTRI